MSHLIPEVRVNKNGVPVTKHVKPSGTVKDAKVIPAPTAYQPLPSLKGKVLKEANEILRLAQNGSQDYDDAITGAYLDNNIRYMRILSKFLNNGEYSHPEATTATDIIDTRLRLGLGSDESEEEFAEKCQKYVEMIDGDGPAISDDFNTREPSDESGKIIVWLEENWDDIDEIIPFFQERHMDDYSAQAFSSLWSEYKNFSVKPLRDGFI